MTAEILIMNKSSVAMAADSAGSIKISEGYKINNSMNKIFMLSKYQPVGIMVYGNSQFMGVPWETLIHLYRTNIKDKSKDTLREYGEDFMLFLRNQEFFDEALQEKYFIDRVATFLDNLSNELNKHLYQKIIVTNATVKKSDKVKIVQKTLKDIHSEWKKTKDLADIKKKFINETFEKFKDKIDQLIDNFVKRVPINVIHKQIIADLCKFKLSKQKFTDYSGVVIAGFGDKQNFPAYTTYECEFLINGIFKYREIQSYEIQIERRSAVVPFAQPDMVKLFMKGIHDSYEEFLHGFMNTIFKDYTKQIVNDINKLTPTEKDDIHKKIDQDVNKMMNNLQSSMSSYSLVKFVQPITQTVSHLPKDDLASMAESLVNLTSIKRRLSINEEETVGGPIDVAVISKKDGFIWIKRKHYFKPELNSHFFENYFTDCKESPHEQS